MRANALLSVRTLTAACMLVLAACSSSESPPEGEIIDGLRVLSDYQNGIATWYDATGAGHCGYDASPEDMDVAAMNAPQFNNSAV